MKYVVLTDEAQAIELGQKVLTFSQLSKNVDASIYDGSIVTESGKFYLKCPEQIDHSSYSSEVSYNLPSELIQQNIETILSGADDFGNKLMSDFRHENIMLGITQLGKTARVLSEMVKPRTLADGSTCSLLDILQSGSLTVAEEFIDLMKAEVNGTCDPFLSNDRLEIYKQRIISYLG